MTRHLCVPISEVCQRSVWTVPDKVPGLSLPLDLPPWSHRTWALSEVLRPPNTGW